MAFEQLMADAQRKKEKKKDEDVGKDGHKPAHHHMKPGETPQAEKMG